MLVVVVVFGGSLLSILPSSSLLSSLFIHCKPITATASALALIQEYARPVLLQPWCPSSDHHHISTTITSSSSSRAQLGQLWSLCNHTQNYFSLPESFPQRYLLKFSIFPSLTLFHYLLPSSRFFFPILVIFYPFILTLLCYTLPPENGDDT